MPQKKFRLYYWIVLAFLKKYALYVIGSFFITSIVIALYIFFSREIIQLFATNTQRVGLSGAYTLDNLPREVIDVITVPLFVQKVDGTYESDIVKSYSYNSDFTKYELTLHRDLVYTDGTPFTSHDIPFVFKDVTISYPTPEKILFELSKPFPLFISYLAKPVYSTNPFRGVKGEYILTQVRYVRGGDRLEKIVLSPLMANKPKLVFRFYRSEADLITAYKLREIDTFSTTGSIVTETFSEWSDTKTTQTSDFKRVLALFFDMEHPILKERDARMALYGSIPVALLEQYGNIAVSPISPLSVNYDPTIPRIAENPEVNRAILKKFFSEATESAHLKLATSLELINLAHTIKDVVEGASGTITVDVEGLRPGERADMILGMWDIPSDVNQYFMWHSSQKGRSNITRYENPKVDKLLEDYRATDSASMQKELLIEFQNKIVDDAPAVFLYYPYIFTVTRNK